MNISNFIEAQYRRLDGNLDFEYKDLYKNISNQKLREILTTLHARFINLFKLMNSRLPTKDGTDHFWAEPSRSLIECIEIAQSLNKSLNRTEFAIEIDEYYQGIFEKCNTFLEPSGGSTIPPHMEKIELYYIVPIFKPFNTIIKTVGTTEIHYPIKTIGYGSYATVYRYMDDYYNRYFVIKTANKDLNEKEIQRFKQEYEEMNKLRSPYIVEVFRYDESRNEYTMENMDCTLYRFISKNNSNMTQLQRRNFVLQVLRAFEYIHSKGILHRDISPNNVLIKEYEDTCVLKVSDFGLIKVPDSFLTSIHTELKGWFNDPALKIEGFKNYNILHETYALTLLIFYIMTGKTIVDINKINDTEVKSFVEKGLNTDKQLRFQNVQELQKSFNSLSLHMWN